MPFKKEDLYEGYPEETNAPYGIAKKPLLTQSRAYRKQYDFNSVYLMLVNLYGPRDDFNLETSHVNPPSSASALSPVSEATTPLPRWAPVNSTREFFYVRDAADGILTATERFDWKATTQFEEGLEATIEWYKDNRQAIVDD